MRALFHFQKTRTSHGSETFLQIKSTPVSGSFRLSTRWLFLDWKVPPSVQICEWLLSAKRFMNLTFILNWLCSMRACGWGQSRCVAWTTRVGHASSACAVQFGARQLMLALLISLTGMIWLSSVGTAWGQTETTYTNFPEEFPAPAFSPPPPQRSVAADPQVQNLFDRSPPSVQQVFGEETPALLVPPPLAPPAEQTRTPANEFPSSDSQNTGPSQADWEAVRARLQIAESRVFRLEAEQSRSQRTPISNPFEPLVKTADDVDRYAPDYLKKLNKTLKELPNEKPTYNITGQLQIDNILYSQSQSSKDNYGNLQNATGFRRSRLGVYGELFETTEYRLEWDFASIGRPRMLDNWISLKTLPIPVMHNIIVGHFFEPFSLERYTPNRFITFMERSLIDTFAPARNTGIMAYGHGMNEKVTWASGVFRSESNQFGDAVNDSADYALTTHFTWLPYYCLTTEGRYLWHLGFSHSYRAIGDKQVRFRTRPEANMQALNDFNQPFLIDTGDINADSVNLLGLESAIVWGPFSLQSEVISAQVNRLDGPDPNFWGYYGYVSYFLTGENRSYSKTNILGRFREGIFQRINPHTNALRGETGVGNPRGIGAWEVAARYSYIHLDSHDIEGNRMSAVTLGVNWYINPNTRMQWNYIRNMVQDRNLGSSHSDIFSMRLGYEW